MHELVNVPIQNLLFLQPPIGSIKAPPSTYSDHMMKIDPRSMIITMRKGDGSCYDDRSARICAAGTYSTTDHAIAASKALISRLDDHETETDLLS
jgi:hypothetical protein